MNERSISVPLSVFALLAATALFMHAYSTAFPKVVPAEVTLSRFKNHMSHGRFADAAEMIVGPAKFQSTSNGEWTLSALGELGDDECSVTAREYTWKRRFQNGNFDHNVRWIDPYDYDLESPYWFIQTGVMCDPLQMMVAFVPTRFGKLQIDITPWNLGRRISLNHP